MDFFTCASDSIYQHVIWNRIGADGKEILGFR
jgi:hypothetical protein